jgi:hypothetical protein
VNWSASSIPRLLQCATSALLPQHDYKTKYATEGQDYHAEMESAIDVGDEDAIPSEVLALVQDGDETITEMAFAYDPVADTARELGRITREQYAELVRDDELPGKPDLIIRGNGRVVVVDHKGFLEVDDAERNEQVATYALMVARAWGYDEVEVVIRYRAPWRRPSYATLNTLDLAAHADRLAKLRSDIHKAREMPQLFLNDGAHCKFCPAFLSGCPRQEALARRVQSGQLAAVPFDSDDEATLALELRDRLRTMLNRLEAGLHARAAVRPIPRPNGKVWGPVEKQGARKIDGDKAYPIIRERFGVEVADASVRRSVTQKAIEEALKKSGVKGAAAKKDALVKALEEAGAVERGKKTEFEEYPLALKDAG